MPQAYQARANFSGARQSNKLRNNCVARTETKRTQASTSGTVMRPLFGTTLLFGLALEAAAFGFLLLKRRHHEAVVLLIQAGAKLDPGKVRKHRTCSRKYTGTPACARR